MAVSMADLVTDIAAETAALRSILVGLPDDETGWDRPTPAAGWSVRDQVSHLAYFDEVAVQSATDPETFNIELKRLVESGGVDTEVIAARFRDMPGEELLAWFDNARQGLMDSFGPLDPGLRVPWFGPAMSTASSLTARIMETWAHGQDVVDALGADREPSPRMRHVAHIGVGARPFSFVANGRTPPTEPVRVELRAPDGSTWTWGPPDADNTVSGTALDFCLLVTQRRHRADTDVVATGPVADEWLSIAQAFAGPAGTGREPGQFSQGGSA
ncbi:MAG TPA: TIGR03084 family metal-binding protein [Pseudonocardia sp.]|jgi:uncharacterized protein (TIGR03084 family)